LIIFGTLKDPLFFLAFGSRGLILRALPG